MLEWKNQDVFIKNYIIKNVYLDSRAALPKPHFP